MVMIMMPGPGPGPGPRPPGGPGDMIRAVTVTVIMTPSRRRGHGPAVPDTPPGSAGPARAPGQASLTG